MVSCKTCGQPYDEIPFEPCKEHRLYDRIQEDMKSAEDWDELMEDCYFEALRFQHENK